MAFGSFIARRITILILFCTAVFSSVQAVTIREALDQAAMQFAGIATEIRPGHRIVVSVVNFHSEKQDQTAKNIETELYFALERRYPDIKLILLSESIVGVASRNSVFIKGSYRQQGGIITVRLQALKGALSGEILAQTAVSFEQGKPHRRTLVAVLDLEAETLNSVQRKAFSDIFRTTLGKIGGFDLASSADVDRMDPDQIQKTTGCTRDSCSVVIGEQLGVDRVISSSYMRVSGELYFVTAKLIDIKDGSILVSEKVQHDGDINSLEGALTKLAHRLVGEPERTETFAETSGSNALWHIAALTVAAASGWQAMEEAKKYDELAEQNEIITRQSRNVFTSEYTKFQLQYDENQDQMKRHKSNMQIMNGITALSLLWEAYLLFFSSDPNEVRTVRVLPTKAIVRPVHSGSSPKTGISLVWRF